MTNINTLVTEALGKKSGREFVGGTDTCVCPKCGKETSHKRGIPCNKIKCPDCKVPLTGKGTPGSKI